VRTHVDITERDVRQRALVRSEERYRSVVGNIGIGVTLLSRDFEILTMSRQMGTWFPDIDPSNRPICYTCYNDPPRSEVCAYCPVVRTLKDGQIHEAVTETAKGDLHGSETVLLVEEGVREQDLQILRKPLSAYSLAARLREVLDG